jgi:hypothetical protein
MSEASNRAQAKYDKENTVQFKVKLNKKSDADVIEHLRAQENKQNYIRQLIRADIEKNGN